MKAHLRRSVVTVGLAVLAALGSSGAVSAAQIVDTIRYGTDDGRNINQLPQFIAERQGFFAREGLRVEIINFTSNFRAPVPGQRPISVREAMENDSIDMSRQQLPLLINDALTGRVKGPFVGVSLAVSNPIYFLVVRPEIKTFADLKGKTVTLTGLADGITVWTQKLITQHGLRNEDFTIKSIAGSEARVACMKSGECAAATLGQPAIFEALGAGFHSLGMTNEIAPLLYQVDVAKPAWAARNRNAVVKYIRATAAAMQFIQDPRNRDAVVRATATMMGNTEDRARQMLTYIWDPKHRVLQPRLDMNNVTAAIALLGKFGVLKQPLPRAEQFIDASYARAAGQ